MVSGNSPDELPPGWEEHVKVSNGRKIKYYTNEVMGLKFYSKKRVIHFVNTKDTRHETQDTHQSMTEHDQNSGCSKTEASPSQVVVEKNESLEWLPRGWLIESRTRKSGIAAGSVYKTYIDPLTGCKFYSKPQVIQYVERLNRNATPEKQKEVSGDNSSKKDAPKHCESMKGKSKISGKKENVMVKPSVEIISCEVNGDDSSKEVTRKSQISGKGENGIRKAPLEIITCDVSGDDSSMQNAPQTCESKKGKSHISEKEENGMGKPSLETDVDESNVLDELPPGWIKEIRARKRGVRKDPYYIDPVSGYEFRSKKDALRYLQFGDISRCAIIPKKRERSGYDISAQFDGKELGQAQAVGQMAEGDVGSCHRAILAAPEAERSREMEGDNKSSDAKFSTSTRNVVQDMQFCSAEIKGHTSWESPQPKTECSNLGVKAIQGNGSVSNSTAVIHEQQQSEAKRLKETPCFNISADAKVTPSTVDLSDVLKICFELRNCDASADSSQPKSEGSKLDVKDEDYGAVTSTANAVLQEQKRPEDYLDTELPIQLKKSKKRKAQSTPARSSKRLSGKEPEILLDSGLSERALRAAAKKTGQTEASSMAQNSVAEETPGQVDTQPQSEVNANLTSPCRVASLEPEMQNIEKPSQDQVAQEQAVGKIDERQEEEKPISQDYQFLYSFGETFSDPCYEFAFKTLTGEIPFEDTLSFPGCFQQQTETSFTHGNAGIGLSGIDTPALFQNDVPFHFESVQPNTSADQVPPKSTVPPGNINSPGCSSLGSQQPSLEARSKDYETKVKS